MMIVKIKTQRQETREDTTLQHTADGQPRSFLFGKHRHAGTTETDQGASLIGRTAPQWLSNWILCAETAEQVNLSGSSFWLGSRFLQPKTGVAPREDEEPRREGHRSASACWNRGVCGMWGTTRGHIVSNLQYLVCDWLVSFLSLSPVQLSVASSVGGASGM